MEKITRHWDEIDESCEREGNARRRMRVEFQANPTALGKRISGAKARYGHTQIATNFVMSRTREEKRGFGA